MDRYGLTEEEKKTNLQKYNHALFRNMMCFMDFVWEVNPKTGTVVILEDKNDTAKSGMEYQYEEFLNLFIEEKIRDTDQNLCLEYLAMWNLKKMKKQEKILLFIRSIGNVWDRYQVVITPAFHNEKLYCVYVGAHNLQTDEKHEMEELKRTVSQEEQFRLAAISGSLMVYNINLTQNLIEDEFYEIVDGKHYPMLEMVGLTPPCSFDEFCKRWSETKITEEGRETFLQTYNRQYMLDAYEHGEKQIEIEFDTVIGRGIPITIRNTAILVEDHASGDILAMVYTKDVSAQREAEYRQREALRAAYEATNTANAAKSDFLARMSHDIRTPMNAIIGMTAIAEMHLGDTERIADCLEKINSSSKHLLGLINEVLDMSKIESGKLDLQEEAFVLPDMIDALLTQCKPQIAVKKQELSVSIHNIEHENVIGDSQRIEQAFINLLSNATKYTPEGGKIQFSITEKPTNKPNVGCFEFIVEDNGIGMSEDFQQILFDPFARANDVRISKIQGTGLGMAITKSIVQMMNGTITVKSSLNRGTRFTVVVFLKLQDEDKIAPASEIAGLQVLVIDDDEMACASTCEVLEELGIQSEYALSGEEAIAKIFKRHEDGNDYFAVMVDWRMPGMDGVSTTKVIRQTVGEHMPIIVVSAYDWSDIEEEARESGATAFIGKPLFKSRLSLIFRELLAEGELEDAKSPIEMFSEADFTGKRALLVEDNELNAEIAAEILHMVGLEVEFATNGKEALDIMEKIPDGYFDIIFMDIQMPLLNGYQATRAIRALDREYTRTMPIIAMSANAFADDVHEAKASGMNEHVAKPLDFNHLKNVLTKWLS